MMNRKREFEMLGSEALPGGLADIHRTLQPNVEPIPPGRKPSARRGLMGIISWRRKQKAVT